MKYKAKISYDGSLYYGFQRLNELPTIQKELEKAISIINKKESVVKGASRTDKGVHALCQYAHTDLSIDITEAKLKRALNSNLPDDIHIISTKIVDKDFHARYNVKEKEYKYYINLGEYNPIERKYVFQYNHELNIENMSQAIKYFIGTHDYRAFVTENKEKENCIRTITKATITKEKEKLIITFQGNGFLRYQVRNMVGILIRVGENNISPETVEKILESKDRTKSGKTAPAQGLYLTNIEYN